MAKQEIELPQAQGLTAIRRPLDGQVRRSLGLGSLLFVAPAVIIFASLMVFPLLHLAGLSLFEWSGFPRSPMRWVGLENFRKLLFEDRIFWQSVQNTLVYTAIVTVAWSTISLFLALLLSTKPRGFAFYRMMFFAPAVMSEVAVAIAWRQVLEPNIGFLNVFLRAVGVQDPPVWLGNPSIVLFVLSVISIWQWVGYSMVIYLAGLQTIPKDLSEAARTDGANEIMVVRHITLPLMKPFIVLVSTLNLIGALKVFAVVYAVTQGGPAHYSEVVTSYMYINAYVLNQQGYASAIAMLLVIGIVVLTLAFRRTSGGAGGVY